MTVKHKPCLRASRIILIVIVTVLALTSPYRWLPASVWAAIKLSPPFDFNDNFYAKNGICTNADPSQGCTAGINNLGPDSRVGFAAGTDTGPEFGTNPVIFGGKYNWIDDSTNTDPTRGGARSGIRVTQTTGGFDKDGNLIYYSIMAPVPDDRFFTNNAAGTRAHSLANQFRAFIFPKQLKGGVLRFDPCPIGTQPGTPAAAACVVLNPPPGNRRQDNLFDTKDEYFCGNLLGLWLIEMVVFTPQSQTMQGQQALAALVAQNGASLDGTPVFKTLDQITQLVNAGYVQLLELPAEPHPGPGDPRYVV